MINGSMRRKLFTDAPIDTAFVSSEMGFPRSHRNDQRSDSLRRNIRDMEGTRLSATLNKREDGFLRRRSLIGAVPGPAADIGFIRFNEFPFAAERVRGDAYTNTVEGMFSLLKRGIYGIYQHVSEAHLHRYLNEFDFRYNNRVALGVTDTERATRAIQGAAGKRLFYRQPRSESEEIPF